MKREIFFVCLAIVLAALLRFYRLPTDLLFHRDQGMHALGIWQVWHEGQIKLLGHSTDVDGIYHGPWYYWLMVPAYALSGGDPLAAISWQIFLELLSLPLFYLAIKRIFNRQTAQISLILYAVSFLLLGYSRWLNNVGPLLTVVNILLWTLTKLSANSKKGHYFAIGLLCGLASQLNGAVGFALIPTVILSIRPRISVPRIIMVLLGIVVLLFPQVAFELRHNFVEIRAVLTFIRSSSGGGFSFWTLFANMKEYLHQIGYLASFQLPLIGIALFSLGIFSLRHHPQRNLVFAWLLLPPLTLALFKRGALGFFYVFNFGLALSVIAYTLQQTRRRWGLLIFLLILALNLYHGRRLLKPDNGLTPIGDANIITLQDRKYVLDFIYQTSQGKPFALWTYTLPYYQDDALLYMFVWYGQSRLGRQPLKIGGFSPADLKTPYHFYAVYEPDEARPWRLNVWLTELETNFGQPLAVYRSHGIIAAWYGQVVPK